MNHFTNILPAVLIIAIFTLVIISHLITQFKKAKVKKDLIYLEFLIQHSLKEPVSEKSIRKMIYDYRGKDEYNCNEFNKCVRLFNEKFK